MGITWKKNQLSTFSKSNTLLFSTRIWEYEERRKERTRLHKFGHFLAKNYTFSLGQIKTDEYQEEKEAIIPVIDQSKTFINGYTDRADLVFKGQLPVIVFGDHSRNFKYVDFPFVQGADGLKIIKVNDALVNPKFFYHLLKIISVPSRGYNRHYTVLVEQYYPLIERTLQDEIVTEIAKIEVGIKHLGQQIQIPLAVVNHFFAQYYSFDASLWRVFGKSMTAGTQKSEDKQTIHYKTKLSNFRFTSLMRFSGRFHNETSRELETVLEKNGTIKLKDIIIEPIRRGVQPKIEEEGEVNAVKTGQLKNGYFDFEDCDKVSLSYYEKNEKAQVRQGDVLLACTGKVSLGKVDYVDFVEKGLADGHIAIIRIDEKKYNPLFLTYFLRSILGAYQIERDYTGATNQIELYANEIGNFKIPNLSVATQNEIVAQIKQQLDAQKDIEQAIEGKQAEISQLIMEAIK
jgi:hypothetical protein